MSDLKMEPEKMIKNLQDRFSLSPVQASVMYYSLQKHFLDDQNMKKDSSHLREGN